MSSTTRPRLDRQAELSSADAIMWRIEADPVLRSPILVVGVLDREPADEAVRAAVERWVHHAARFRCRAVIAPWGPAGSHWEEDERFSLDYHLRRVRAPRPGDMRSLLGLAEPMATAPFDPARPPWDLTVVEGMDAGRAGLVLRFHHTITDGVGGIAMASRLFDVDRAGRPPAGPPAAAAATPATPEVSPTLLDRAAALTRAPAHLTAAALRRGRHPLAATRADLRVARSVARALAPVPAPLSPVFGPRGLDRTLDVLEVPLAGLTHAATAMSCTLNDLFLAVVGGALHDYHARLGHPVAALRFTMPISLRTGADPEGGNRFAPARFVLPIDDPDLATRARIAGIIARRWRDEPALGMTGQLAALLDRLPGPVVTRLFATMLEHIDIDAVNVPGLQREAFLAGGRVERLWGFAPPTGAALSITLLSHVDTCCIGLNADRASVRDPALLQTCLAAAFDEALAAEHAPAAAGAPA